VGARKPAAPVSERRCERRSSGLCRKAAVRIQSKVTPRRNHDFVCFSVTSVVEKTMLTATKARIEPGKLLIGGEWVSASQNFDTINPATGGVITQVSTAGAQEVDRAVKAARKAFEDRNGPWQKMSASERGRLLWRVADLLEKNIDEIA